MHGETPYSVRIWRWRHPGRDPLVRTSDRLEALLLILVLVGAGLALPVTKTDKTGVGLRPREARQDRPHLTVPAPPT